MSKLFTHFYKVEKVGLRSIIDTCAKNGTNVFNALKLTAIAHPE